MGNIFSAGEVVLLGIQIEKNGRDFYNTLVGRSKVLGAQEVFRFLAGEEEKHIQVFEGILGKTQRFEPQGLDSDEYFSYMAALAAEHIFTQKNKGLEIAQAIKGDKEAIDMAIRFEEDSIVFYEGIKKVVPQDEEKIVSGLVIQEESHLKQLLELKKLIQKG